MTISVVEASISIGEVVHPRYVKAKVPDTSLPMIDGITFPRIVGVS